jgi:hypothetical protein
MLAAVAVLATLTAAQADWVKDVKPCGSKCPDLPAIGSLPPPKVISGPTPQEEEIARLNNRKTTTRCSTFSYRGLTDSVCTTGTSN